MRFFIRLSFDGTDYHGWQIQENANSVQEEINKSLKVILKSPQIETVGCGRTDTGVHAQKFYAHFDYDSEIHAEETIRQLNAILPQPIAVHSLFRVDDKAHARFDATSRTYVYRIYSNKNPFLNGRSYYFHGSPDLEIMNEFAGLLKEMKDFSSFAKSNTQVLTNNCVITFAHWEKEGEEIIFTITADRFLRNMVRAIVGTLLNAGMKKTDKTDFLKILESKNRSVAGYSVPAHGLYLTDVKYPFKVL